MLLDPVFAASVLGSEADEQPGSPAAGRFALREREVMRRTNGALVEHRLHLPWPPALGTSPPGAARELERVTGREYQVAVVRWLPQRRLRQVHCALADVVTSGAPVLLYVGSPALPRHVVLLLRAADGGAAGRPGASRLDVYDPATGTVSRLEPGPFARARLGIAGWDVPWLVLRPLSRPAAPARRR